MSANIEQIKAMLERAGKISPLQEKKVDLEKERLQLGEEQQKITDDELAMLLAVIREPANAASESCHLALQSIYGKLTMKVRAKLIKEK